MKNTTIAAVLASIALGAAVIIPASAQDASSTTTATCTPPKVLVTENKRLYKDITNLNATTSCGIRLTGMARTKVLNAIENEKTIRTMQDQASAMGHEKIATLNDVKNYINIRKIGTSLWGFPKDSGTPRPVLRNGAAQCAITATNAKDTKIINLNNTMNSRLTTLITTRGNCQTEALATTTKQLVRLNKCANNFRTGYNTLSLDKNKSYKTIIDEYNASITACSPAITSDKSAMIPAASISDGSSVN